MMFVSGNGCSRPDRSSTLSRRLLVFLISTVLVLTAVVGVSLATSQTDGNHAAARLGAALSVRTPATGNGATPGVAAASQPDIAVQPHATETHIPRTPTEEPLATAPGTTTTSIPVAGTALSPLAPVGAAPIRLRIPALDIDSTVEWVGIDDEGRMDVPGNYDDVAWYEDGPRPGMPGNAVIAGHLDSTTGPAVFYRLDTLQPGDEVFVATHAGNELRFVVVGKEAFDANAAPLERIFGPGFAPHLNLITCEGAFSRSSGQYDQRLVVFTVLADS
jgi:sortase (surface protein transpeptidase)